MNKFINYIIEKSKDLDLTLKIEYSTHIGWTIKLHEKGYDMPSVVVKDDDRDKAFKNAYKVVNEYMRALERKKTTK